MSAPRIWPLANRLLPAVAAVFAGLGHQAIAAPRLDLPSNPQPAPASLTQASLVTEARLSIPNAAAEASRFVQSYPTIVTNQAVSTDYHWVVRFDGQLCAKVFGLPPDQAAALKSRIYAVAEAAALRLSSPYRSCPQTNLWIVFTPNPQGELDKDMAKDRPNVGDSANWIWDVKTVSRPIQAWYDMRICYACGPRPIGAGVIGALVLVDPVRTGGANLETIADYVAMLVLSEPRSPERCQTLPSIMDLFAGACPGRPAPTGLTPTDLAYLKAVYTAGARLSRPDLDEGAAHATTEDVAGRLGMLLAGAAPVPVPGVAPVKQFRPGIH